MPVGASLTESKKYNQVQLTVISVLRFGLSLRTFIQMFYFGNDYIKVRSG